MAFGPASARGGYRYPEKQAAAVKIGWAKATAAKQTGASPTAAAGSLLRRVRLLGGAVRARRIVVSASVSPQAATAGGRVQGLVVLGRHVHPATGASLKLAGWGTLDVLASTATHAGGSAAAAIAGLRLTLLQAHDGLPAGTVIELGAARAAITAAAPPPPQPPGGTGPTTPTAPQRTLGTTVHPRPVRPTAPKHHQGAGHPVDAAGATQAPPAGPPTPAAGGARPDRGRRGRARAGDRGRPRPGRVAVHLGRRQPHRRRLDCSGLVDYAYGRAGMTLPGRPTAAVLWRMSMPVGRARLQPGDLAFLYSRNRAPYHVALYVGDGLVVVAPHTGADVEIEPLAAITWDGYGRLLSGGRGDGLARSVAAAARRFAHPGPGALRRLAAATAADAIAERRVLPPDLQLNRIVAGTQTETAAELPRLVPLASVKAPQAAGAGRVLGFALLLLLVAACLVWAPIRAIRSSGG